MHNEDTGFRAKLKALLSNTFRSATRTLARFARPAIEPLMRHHRSREAPTIVASLNRPPDSPCLRQGEILENLFELKLRIDQTAVLDSNQPAKLNPVDHPYTIIVSQDCDLEWDYKARQGQVPDDKLLTHVLFCALFLKDEICNRNRLNSRLFSQVKENQHERYHHLNVAYANGTDVGLELFADFKTTFSVPIEFVYWLVSTGQVTRKGSLGSPYLEDFMHRLYSFLGRVAVPSPQES